MKRPHGLSLLLALALVGGCNRREPTPPDAAAAPARAPDAATAPDAGELEGDGDAGAPLEGANLLQLVPADIAVSSNVDNPRDFPEHLLDGNLDTAWNGKTGDLRGSIWFRVPNDVRVDRVDIVAGFAKKTRALDFFTANHRLKKLAVWHEGVRLREVELEPNVRGYQAIPVGRTGGTFRLEVLETVPGTKAAWRELVVSELRVIGKPGAERRADDAPMRVRVGGLDAPLDTPSRIEETTSEPRAFPSIAALCASSVKAAQAAPPEPLDERYAFLETAKKVAPFCRELPLTGTFKGDAQWKSVHAVRSGAGAFSGTALVVETPAGFVGTPIGWDVDHANPTGCPSIWLASDVDDVRIDNGWLVATVDGEAYTYVEVSEAQRERDRDTGERLRRARGATWCKLAGAKLTCRSYEPQMMEPLAFKVQPRQLRSKMTPWAAIPWEGVHPFHVTPDGALAVEPIKSARP